MESLRINVNLNEDKLIKVNLQQNFDLLEVLSLKISQKDIYTSLCSDYGVVCGRITVNNGLGIPNAKVSIFIPLEDNDIDNPIITSLYPYRSISDIGESGLRYNLLPKEKQHPGHQPVGSFPNQDDILNREEYLEVFEKYYKYAVKTNNSGDFMIWGVPVGEHILHVDVDLSDIGCISLRPDDFIRKGFGVDDFNNTYDFKQSVDIDSLPQIKNFNKTIEVYPFWGNQDLCDIGITRTDFDLSELGIFVEPKALLIGGTYTDSGKLSVNKNCQPRKNMGRKCDLTTKSGKIEFIRFTTEYDEEYRPILEKLEVNETFDDDGSFVTYLPMNMDYMYTNEFGNIEYTNNPKKGVPTSGCYRIKVSLDSDDMERTRTTASYLIPNIREYVNDSIKSYSFSLDYNDYPKDSLPYILNTNDGFYTPKDYFYRFSYNKVYTVSSFQNSSVLSQISEKNNYIGIKDILPSEENDCSGEIITPPINFGTKNYNFQLFIADVLLFFEHMTNVSILTFYNTMVRTLNFIADNFGIIEKPIRKLEHKIKDAGQRKLSLITYPECEDCDNTEFGEDNAETIPEFVECYIGKFYVKKTEDDLYKAYYVTHEFNSECELTFENFSDFYDNRFEYGFILKNEIGNEKYYTIGDLMYDNGQFYMLDSFFVDEFGNEFPIYQTDVEYEIQIFHQIRIEQPLVEYNNPVSGIRDGCKIYNVPYDESLIKNYFYDSETDRKSLASTENPSEFNIDSTNISDIDYNSNDSLRLPIEWKEDLYARKTRSGLSEFLSGCYVIVPGTQSNSKLWKILREYRRRKRIGSMFCGGIVNYSYIDNWLSGSLYFFQFKSKDKSRKKEKEIKFCRDLIKYIEKDNSFYYRSTQYNTSDNSWGTRKPFNVTEFNIGRPTTFVDLGPRDEFIKDICTDKALDANCSVSRSIGASTHQDIGELVSVGINYRLDVSNRNKIVDFTLDNFFKNEGFKTIRNVLSGDILQLISINNEVGVEEFDLQNSKYVGYSYQFLDPELDKDVFVKNNVYGPLPITLSFSEEGVRIRSCLNEVGRLTESAQEIPFFLWDKKNVGFGSYDITKYDSQSWDYQNVMVMPIQGMSYGYEFNNDESDKYLLLPITYNYSGKTKTISGLTLTYDFDFISYDDVHQDFNTQYPGFTFLMVTEGTLFEPIRGIRYTRTGNSGWDTQEWSNDNIFIKKTEDYYGRKQILSTPFVFYFGLRLGKTGLDKFIKKYGPKDYFKEELISINSTTCSGVSIENIVFTEGIGFVFNFGNIDGCNDLIQIEYSDNPMFYNPILVEINCTSTYVLNTELPEKLWYFRARFKCDDIYSDWYDYNLAISNSNLVNPTILECDTPIISEFYTENQLNKTFIVLTLTELNENYGEIIISYINNQNSVDWVTINITDINNIKFEIDYQNRFYYVKIKAKCVNGGYSNYSNLYKIDTNLV